MLMKNQISWSICLNKNYTKWSFMMMLETKKVPCFLSFFACCWCCGAWFLEVVDSIRSVAVVCMQPYTHILYYYVLRVYISASLCNQLYKTNFEYSVFFNFCSVTVVRPVCVLYTSYSLSDTHSLLVCFILYILLCYRGTHYTRTF